EERLPGCAIDAGAEPERLQASARDRAVLDDQVFEVGAEGGVEAVEIQAEYAAAVVLERRLSAGGVELEERLRTESAEEEVPQRRSVAIGGPLVPVVPLGPGEPAERPPAALPDRLPGAAGLLDRVVALVGLGPALGEHGGCVEPHGAVVRD